MTILIRSVQLFSEYLGKTRGNSLHFRLYFPMPMSPDEFFCTSGQAHIVQYGGWMGESTLTMAD